MTRFQGSSLVLFLVLGACGKKDAKPVAGAASAPPSAALTDAPPALSPAEEQPGKPIDLGDGLILQVERAGTGKIAHAGSRVQLTYHARIKDSETIVVSTEDWDTPLATTIGANDGAQLLPALERALTGLRAGCSAKLEVPSALGYGKNGPAGTEDKALVFQLELVGVDG